jgi:hypothetical protein
MKWVIVVIGLLAFAAALIAAAGSLLPVKHRAARKARFRQAPRTIYAIVSGPPDWRADVKAWGALPETNGRKRWWEQDSRGGKISYELMEDSATRRVTRIADDTLPFGGTWTVEIMPLSGDESEVRVTEDGEVYNVIFRFMSRFVFGYTAGIEAYLRNLGEKLGEQPRIEA